MPGEFEIIIKNDPTHLALTAATTLNRTAQDCITKKGRMVVAVSGGSTPRGMHKILAKEPYRSDVAWDKVHIFWVDERCVPRNNPASNYGLAKEDFLGRLPIPAEQIHPMPGEVLPDEGAIIYWKELKEFFQLNNDDYPVFDLIFLGVGEDGHTASLFPGQAAINEREKWVVAVKGGNPNVNRLTLTYPVLNRAKQIYFLVSGKEKAAILKTIFENPRAQLPAQKIQPLDGKLTWLIDRGAASLLSGEITYDASR